MLLLIALAFKPSMSTVRLVGEIATCTGIHGEAFSDVYLATGCDEGILKVTGGTDGLVMKLLEYPADLPESESTRTLLGSKAMQVFLVNYGAKCLVEWTPFHRTGGGWV